MRRLGVFLLMLVLLSGCGSKGDPDLPTDPGDETTPTAAFLDIQSNLPEWGIGQSWTYWVERPGLPTEKFRMMVAEDREDLWVVATENRTQAINHAVYSTNPMLGRIGKETLSPFQSGAPVKMYQFPLSDGQTWQATFFGDTMNFQATYVGDIDSTYINPERNLPKRIDGFRILATGGDATIHYDYVEAVEWFTMFEIRNAQGERQIRLTLADFEERYSGAYYFYRGAPDDESLIQQGAHEASSVPPTTTQTHPAQVSDAFQDVVALGVVYVGKPSTPAPRLEVTLLRPDGAQVVQRTLLSSREWHLLQDVEGVPGTWTLQLNMTGTFSYEARVFGVSRYAEGTL